MFGGSGQSSLVLISLVAAPLGWLLVGRAYRILWLACHLPRGLREGGSIDLLAGSPSGNNPSSPLTPVNLSELPNHFASSCCRHIAKRVSCGLVFGAGMHQPQGRFR
ncbi:hypothetical protein BJ322DRAFT_1077280 [Thelephora terrestris]|uniref:Uncharacterized protein n=1 Tax=Thelephora terrestris TaxID=56493 RepID=A0A9P6H9U7_9AGAM|nr:hypothetical protein BJ322DRAFT_1077280 [Thelephora terrestris]